MQPLRQATLDQQRKPRNDHGGKREQGPDADDDGVRQEESGAQQHDEAAPPERLASADTETGLVHRRGYGTRVRRASFLLLALVIAAGCGGGGSSRLTREQYAAKADAICGKYNQQTKALANPSNLSDLAKVADQTIPILSHALTDLRKLKPPANEQATVDQWLVQVENLKGDLAEIRDKAKSNDIQGVQNVVPKATQHNAKSNQLATQLGMKVCNRD
jgi:hypothetical protein